MNRIGAWCCTVVGLGLIACDDRAPAAATVDSSRAEAPATLTAEGWGPLRIGMTRDQVVAAAGEDADPLAVGGPDPERCDEFRPVRAPRGMIVMIEQGRLTRISLGAGSTLKTDQGFGVGDSASTIKSAYGSRAVSSRHQYHPAPAEYITAWTTASSDSNARGVVYDVGADGRVDLIRAGGRSIEYVEGCV